MSADTSPLVELFQFDDLTPPASRSTPANLTQVGGGHYKGRLIEPWDFCAANGLDAFQSSIVRYVVRWREKGGVEDLRKARHYLDKLIELALAGYPDRIDPNYFIAALQRRVCVSQETTEASNESAGLDR